MNKDLVKFASDAGFMLWDDESWKPEGAIVDWSCDYDRELEKFAELIVIECNKICMSQADKRNILKRFGLPVEDPVKYYGPEPKNSIESQYNRPLSLPDGK